MYPLSYVGGGLGSRARFGYQPGAAFPNEDQATNATVTAVAATVTLSPTSEVVSAGATLTATAPTLTLGTTSAGVKFIVQSVAALLTFPSSSHEVGSGGGASHGRIRWSAVFKRRRVG